MNLFGMIDQSGNAMQAERMRAEVVAANMSNAETTRTPDGTPYRRQHVVFATGDGDQQFSDLMTTALPSTEKPFRGINPDTAIALSDVPTQLQRMPLPYGLSTTDSGFAPGVHVAAVIQDRAGPLKRYDPNHPDADSDGYVSYPDINPLTEMVDLMGATRAYGLNASAVQAEKSMISSALEIAK